MVLGRSFGDHQLRGELAVGQALGHELSDFALASGERLRRVCGVDSTMHGGDPLSHRSHPEYPRLGPRPGDYRPRLVHVARAVSCQERQGELVLRLDPEGGGAVGGAGALRSSEVDHRLVR